MAKKDSTFEIPSHDLNELRASLSKIGAQVDVLAMLAVTDGMDSLKGDTLVKSLLDIVERIDGANERLCELILRANGITPEEIASTGIAEPA